MQAVGVRAGVHREGHHGGAQHVLQGVVQKTHMAHKIQPSRWSY